MSVVSEQAGSEEDEEEEDGGEAPGEEGVMDRVLVVQVEGIPAAPATYGGASTVRPEKGREDEIWLAAKRAKKSAPPPRGEEPQ